MPQEKFEINKDNLAGTLELWAKKLTYLFNHIESGSVIIGVDAVKDYMIDFGTGTQQVDAYDLPISDTGGFFASTSVESAFNEIGNKLIRVYDDIRVPVTATQTGGAKQPGFSVFKTNGSGSQGVFTYMFDAGLEEELFFTVQVPHSYSAGTNLYPHVHWCPTSTQTGNVVWGLEQTWSNIGDTFGNTAITTVIQSANTIIGKHQYASFPVVTGTGKETSSMLVCRVYRDASSTDDTYPADAALLEIDFHFMQDKLGTTSIITT